MIDPVETVFDLAHGVPGVCAAVLTRKASGETVPTTIKWSAASDVFSMETAGFHASGMVPEGRHLDVLRSKVGSVEHGDEFAVTERGVVTRWVVVGEPSHPPKDLSHKKWRCNVAPIDDV